MRSSAPSSTSSSSSSLFGPKAACTHSSGVCARYVVSSLPTKRFSPPFSLSIYLSFYIIMYIRDCALILPLSYHYRGGGGGGKKKRKIRVRESHAEYIYNKRMKQMYTVQPGTRLFCMQRQASIAAAAAVILLAKWRRASLTRQTIPSLFFSPSFQTIFSTTLRRPSGASSSAVTQLAQITILSILDRCFFLLLLLRLLLCLCSAYLYAEREREKSQGQAGTMWLRI